RGLHGLSAAGVPQQAPDAARPRGREQPPLPQANRRGHEGEHPQRFVARQPLRFRHACLPPLEPCPGYWSRRLARYMRKSVPFSLARRGLALSRRLSVFPPGFLPEHADDVVLLLQLLCLLHAPPVSLSVALVGVLHI